MHEKICDRRRHFRFNAVTGSLRLLHSPANAKLGELLNISYGGIAYRYAPNAEQTDDGLQLHRFRVSDTALLLNCVTPQIVYDFDASDVFQVSYGKYRIRGIKFANMRAEQKSQIEKYIREHTLIKKYLH